MRSVEANFLKIEKRNHNQGAFISLAQAVRGKGFSRKSIVKAFKNLMPEEEYAKDETKALIDNLENFARVLEEGEIRGK